LPSGGGQYNETVQLFSFLSQLGGPVIVTGDFNAAPEDPPIIYLSSKMSDAWTLCGSGTGYTFNSSSPFERIDYQFTYVNTLVFYWKELWCG
jgi:endonuclease/exonuclease/phosphatase (EEP) superfamily protein YafD